MVDVRYINDKDTAFVKTLHSRVDAFFAEEKTDRRGNSKMYRKTIFSLVYFIGIYCLILFGGIENLIVLAILWGMMGLGQAFLGMNIMHDKVHGAYSSNFFVNLLLELPIVAIGVDSFIWSVEHNFYHHNYPNMEGIDQDIHPRFLFRFSSHQPKKWFHRFQHIYAGFIYSLLIIEWVTLKDFIKIRKYYKEKFVKSKSELWFRVISILLKKCIFFTLYFWIPMIVLHQNWHLALLMLSIKVLVSGFVMTVIFQTAHVVPNCDFIDPKNSAVTDSWHKHQLKTTANFARNNKIVTFLLGGLNFQIEHHLFPDICHIHYPKLSQIVKKTAEEFKLPYHENGSIWSTIKCHFLLLKNHGKV